VGIGFFFGGSGGGFLHETDKQVKRSIITNPKKKA